jgi:hypothetical protein
MQQMRHKKCKNQHSFKDKENRRKQAVSPAAASRCPATQTLPLFFCGGGGGKGGGSCSGVAVAWWWQWR